MVGAAKSPSKRSLEQSSPPIRSAHDLLPATHYGLPFVIKMTEQRFANCLNVSCPSLLPMVIPPLIEHCHSLIMVWIWWRQAPLQIAFDRAESWYCKVPGKAKVVDLELRPNQFLFHERNCRTSFGQAFLCQSTTCNKPRRNYRIGRVLSVKFIQAEQSSESRALSSSQDGFCD